MVVFYIQAVASFFLADNVYLPSPVFTLNHKSYLPPHPRSRHVLYHTFLWIISNSMESAIGVCCRIFYYNSRHIHPVLSPPLAQTPVTPKTALRANWQSAHLFAHDSRNTLISILPCSSTPWSTSAIPGCWARPPSSGGASRRPSCRYSNFLRKSTRPLE